MIPCINRRKKLEGELSNDVALKVLRLTVDLSLVKPQVDEQLEGILVVVATRKTKVNTSSATIDLTRLSSGRVSRLIILMAKMFLRDRRKEKISFHLLRVK